MCKPAKSATAHHCRFLPLIVTPPVGLALATGGTIQRPGPARFKLFATDRTSHCERRCGLFGPMLGNPALSRAIQAVGPLWCVGCSTVGAIVVTKSPAFHHSPSSIALHKTVMFSSIGQNAGNVKRHRPAAFLSGVPSPVCFPECPARYRVSVPLPTLSEDLTQIPPAFVRWRSQRVSARRQQSGLV